MKNYKFFLLIFVVLFLTSIVSAQNTTCIYFFYGDGCQHCARVEPQINKIAVQSEFPVEVYKFEIYNNRSNMILLNQYFDAFNIQDAQRGIPVVLIGNNYLIGDSPI